MKTIIILICILLLLAACEPVNQSPLDTSQPAKGMTLVASGTYVTIWKFQDSTHTCYVAMNNQYSNVSASISCVP